MDLIDTIFRAALDGTEQAYVIALPDDAQAAPDQPRDLMIALHGHGSDRWQFARDPRDECRAARDAATERGMIYVSPDYRAPTSWMGPAAVADMCQLIADLRAAHPIARVILVGGSMGGSSALTFAALHPELIAGVAAMNPTANHLEYTNFQDAIAASFGGSKREIPEVYKAHSAEYWPERLTMPIGLSLGGRDESVPPHSVRRLAAVLAAIGRPVHLIDRPERGHDTTYADARAIIHFAIDGVV